MEFLLVREHGLESIYSIIVLKHGVKFSRDRTVDRPSQISTDKTLNETINQSGPPQVVVLTINAIHVGLKNRSEYLSVEPNFFCCL